MALIAVSKNKRSQMLWRFLDGTPGTVAAFDVSATLDDAVPLTLELPSLSFELDDTTVSTVDSDSAADSPDDPSTEVC